MSDEIRLNPEQREAVEYVKGPLLVVAGAGTGKTSVLVKKVKYLIAKKLAKPEEILALTFTEKAAREMEERVDKALPYGYFQMWISTFHAFADQVLHEEIAHIGLSPAFKLMTEAESIIFLRNNLFLFDLKYFRPLSNPNKFIESLLQHFSRLQDEDVSPQEYLRWAKKQKENKDQNLELARAYETYQQLKIKSNVFDFSDLLYFLLKLFRQRKSLLTKYQQKFKYILVDEFQDTNIAQYLLIKLLCLPRRSSRGAKAGPNLTVVGDDSQAIYKFRGASVSNILNFMSDYPKAKQITLRKNYRSLQPILDAAYKLIKFNDPDTLEAQLGISKNLVAQRNSPVILGSAATPESVQRDSGQARMTQNNVVNFFLADNVQQEADFVAKEILKLTRSKLHATRYTYSDFAILIRANNYADPFIRALLQRGIPYQFWGPGMLFKQPEIKDLVAYLNFLSDLDDSLSFYRVLSMNVFEIEAQELALLLSFAKKCTLSLFHAIEIVLSFDDSALYREENEIYKKYLPRLQTASKKRLAKIHKMIKKHLGLIKKESAGQILFYFLEDTEMISALVNYKTEKDERQALNVMKFFTKLKAYEAEHEDSSIFAIVDFIKMSMELGESPLIAETDISLYEAVNILTVHSAKGLEFPIVFMINLTDGRFPSRQRREIIEIPKELIKETLPQGDYHLLEERRLFYVGATRAEDKLYFTTSKFYGEGRRERKLSPFVIQMLGEEKIDHEIGRKKEEKAQLSIFDYKKSEERIIKKNPTLNFFSFSQLYTFLTCQLQYKLKYILKIPEPAKGVASFGSTIHISLENFYREFLQNKKIGRDRLLQIYRSSWIPLGYSSKAYEARMKKEGEKMLKNYFHKLHDPKIKILDLERFFKIKIDDIIISGKIDRVDQKPGNKIEIIDYKTGKKTGDKDKPKNLQLAIYFLAAIDPQLYAKKPEEVTLSFYWLQTAEVASAKKGAESVQEIKDSIRKIVDEIREVDWSSSDLKACNRCSYCLLYSDTYV